MENRIQDDWPDATADLHPHHNRWSSHVLSQPPSRAKFAIADLKLMPRVTVSDDHSFC